MWNFEYWLGVYLNPLFTDRIKDGLLGGIISLHQEVDTVQLPHPTAVQTKMILLLVPIF